MSSDSSESELTPQGPTMIAIQGSTMSYDRPACEACDDCTLPTDVVLCSSDGIRFGAHKRNLEIYSNGFPVEEIVDKDVKLPEDSDALMLLLKFMHHQPQPDLSLIASKLLLKFASAAEKYGVYSATGVCKLMVGMSIKDQPFDSFVYAHKAGYTSILEQAGKLAIKQFPAKFFAYAHSIDDTTWRDMAEIETHRLTTAEVHDELQVYPNWPPIFGAWFRKRDQMRDALFNILHYPVPVLHKGGQAHCADWYPFYVQLLLKLSVSPPCASSFDSVVASIRPMLHDCAHCIIAVNAWKDRIHNTLDTLAKKPLSSYIA